MAKGEMDAFHQAVDGLIQKAVEGFSVLRERNTGLAAALEAADKRLANYEESLVETIIDLERRNRQLAADLDAMRQKAAALQGALDLANARSAPAQPRPTDVVEPPREPLLPPENLYFLYGTPPPPTVDTRPTPTDEPTRPPSAEPSPASVDVFNQAYAALQAAFAELNRDTPAPPTERPEAPLNESSLRPPAMEAASEPPRHVVLESVTGDDRIVIPLPSASPPAAAPEPRFGVEMPALPPLARAAEEIELVVSPFDHFGTVTGFVGAVRKAPGVAHVAVRHFQDGTLRLAVRYNGILPFAARLGDIPPYRLRPITVAPHRIEAVLDATGDTGNVG